MRRATSSNARDRDGGPGFCYNFQMHKACKDTPCTREHACAGCGTPGRAPNDCLCLAQSQLVAPCTAFGSSRRASSALEDSLRASSSYDASSRGVDSSRSGVWQGCLPGVSIPTQALHLEAWHKGLTFQKSPSWSSRTLQLRSYTRSMSHCISWTESKTGISTPYSLFPPELAGPERHRNGRALRSRAHPLGKAKNHVRDNLKVTQSNRPIDFAIWFAEQVLRCTIHQVGLLLLFPEDFG